MSNSDTKIKAIEAYNLIKGLILTGKALPGSRLIISDLELKLNVGRGSIREALMRLDKTGLVENIPHKGAIVVPPPSLKEMQYIYNARVEIEINLAVEAMNNSQTSDITQLEEINEVMRTNWNDDVLFFENDKLFHSKIFSLAKMPHLQATAERLMDYVDMFLNAYRYSSVNKEVFLVQHRCIVSAIENKNEVTLRAQMKENILVGFELVEKEFVRLGHRY